MVSDLTEGSLSGHPLEALMFGGAPAHDNLSSRAAKAFPNAVMYGATDTHLNKNLPFEQESRLRFDGDQQRSSRNL